MCLWSSSLPVCVCGFHLCVSVGFTCMYLRTYLYGNVYYLFVGVYFFLCILEAWVISVSGSGRWRADVVFNQYRPPGSETHAEEGGTCPDPLALSGLREATSSQTPGGLAQGTGLSRSSGSPCWRRVVVRGGGEGRQAGRHGSRNLRMGIKGGFRMRRRRT